MAKPTLVVARICGHVEPIERGERYEDPLDERLRALGLGEITGGGTELAEGGGIAFGDLDIELTDLERGLAATTQILTELGAPAGSYLHYVRDGATQRLPFGVFEGVAIFLDGVNLPDSVYESSDIEELATLLEERLADGALGELRASWAGETETSLVFYGPDAEALARALDPVLRGYPLCQNARLVVRYRHPEGPTREERLPLLA